MIHVQQVGFTHVISSCHTLNQQADALFFCDLSSTAEWTGGGHPYRRGAVELTIDGPRSWPTLTTKFVLRYIRDKLEFKTQTEEPATYMAIGTDVG
jgi:hypothetical protein